METPASFVAVHVARVEPLLREEALAEWNAAATGRPEYDEEAAKLHAQIMRIYADPARFQQLRAWHESERFDDARLARQITLLCLDARTLKPVPERGTMLIHGSELHWRE